MSKRPGIDCTPASGSRGGGRGPGPVVRADAEVKALQRALGLGDKADGMFGEQTARLLREKANEPAVQEARRALEQKLGKGRVEGLSQQGRTDRDSCSVNRSGLDTGIYPRADFAEAARKGATTPAPGHAQVLPAAGPADIDIGRTPKREIPDATMDTGTRPGYQKVLLNPGSQDIHSVEIPNSGGFRASPPEPAARGTGLDARTLEARTADYATTPGMQSLGLATGGVTPQDALRGAHLLRAPGPGM